MKILYRGEHSVLCLHATCVCIRQNVNIFPSVALEEIKNTQPKFPKSMHSSFTEIDAEIMLMLRGSYWDHCHMQRSPYARDRGNAEGRMQPVLSGRLMSVQNNPLESL